jgi:very-short-patch-repair endonuclease
MTAKKSQGQTSILGHRAKRLRRNETDAERKLWMHLRDRQMNGCKFRRQQPMGDRYIVDLVASLILLVAMIGAILLAKKEIVGFKKE